MSWQEVAWYSPHLFVTIFGVCYLIANRHRSRRAAGLGIAGLVLQTGLYAYAIIFHKAIWSGIRNQTIAGLQPREWFQVHEIGLQIALAFGFGLLVVAVMIDRRTETRG